MQEHLFFQVIRDNYSLPYTCLLKWINPDASPLLLLSLHVRLVVVLFSFAAIPLTSEGVCLVAVGRAVRTDSPSLRDRGD